MDRLGGVGGDKTMQHEHQINAWVHGFNALDPPFGIQDLEGGQKALKPSG